MTGVPFFLAARAAVSNVSQRPALEMSSRASFGVSAEAKDRAFSGTGLIMQRLPRLPSLSDIHGNGQAAAVGFDLNDLCRPQNGKHLSQLDKVQGLNGGLNLLLTVVLKIEQGLMQRVIGGPFAGLRFLLLQHIPRKLQLEFAIICVAELVAQPGDRGFGRVAGLCKLRRGGDRGPLYICKNAVRNAPFGAVKLEPGAQLGDNASRGIVHSNTSLCALCIGHNAQYSGNSIPIFC